MTIILALASACTDVIEIDTEPVPEILVVDAWLTNTSESQTIRLTKSQPYFTQGFAPGIDDAEVTVINGDSRIFIFESQGDGDYIWSPTSSETLGKIGDEFGLGIDWNGKQYGAISRLNRVPAIDSIRTEFREAEFGFPEGMYAEMFARDIVGAGDTYWIKAYKNGAYLNKPSEINIAYDAGFDPGSQVDGLVFIPPIREFINRIPDPDTDDDLDVAPYAIGDTVRVEIHSITLEAFFFMEVARDQMNNGANTIFAIPLANARSNVIDLGTEEPVLGFFCVSAVSTLETVVEE